MHSSLISKTTPPIISKPVNFVLNIIQNFIISPLRGRGQGEGFIQAAIQKFVDITDKLTAVYGELKAAIKEKTQKFIADIKKKLKSIFFVFGVDGTGDEEKKIDEAKKIFDLKTFVHKLAQKLKNEDKDAH